MVQAADPRTVDYRVREALEFMEAHLAEPLTVTEIARHVGVSADYLESLFHRDTGEAPMHTLRVMRLREAERLLSASQLSQTEVAEPLAVLRPAGTVKLHAWKRLERAPHWAQLRGRSRFSAPMTINADNRHIIAGFCHKKTCGLVIC
jgi:hypothetical protein